MVNVSQEGRHIVTRTMPFRESLARANVHLEGNKMLKTVARIVLALYGALALFAAANVFMDPTRIADQMGLAPVRDLGLATFRGDIGGLFAGSGLFMLAAALRGERWYLIPPLVYAAIALAARTATISLTGYEQEMLTPMVIEGVTIAILLAAYTIFSLTEN
jgi:hypothetical protein